MIAARDGIHLVKEMIEKKPHVKTRLLVVDDQPLILEKLRLLLIGDPDIEMLAESNAALAVEAARGFLPTVILQDLMMPGIDGFELLARYREIEALRNVPVVVLSATDDPKVKERSFLEGANDYLVKLPDQIELLARIRYHSASYLARCERDESFHLLKVSQQQLAVANMHLQVANGLDSLTGIANRRRFDELIGIEWRRGLRHSTSLALLMCDIDYFKQYNDQYGHVNGDLCIKRTASILLRELRRPADFVARYGGEEFVVLLPDTNLSGALQVANACRQQMEEWLLPPEPGSKNGPATMSIGVSTVVPHLSISPMKLVETADAALYEAKRNGRNQVRALLCDVLATPDGRYEPQSGLANEGESGN